MRLHFMLARRVPPVPSAVLVEAWRLLEARGFQVERGTPEEMLTRPDQLSVRHDLYLLKSHTELALSLAGVLHVQGGRLLNPYPNCAATQNKIMASRLLRAAGVPTPDTWVTGDFRLLRDVAATRPLIIKPYLGHRGGGLRIVRRPDELDAVPPPDAPTVVQEYIAGGGEDLKVYVVGEEVRAVRKPFAPDSFTRPGRPCEVNGEVRDIALRCGRAFGLGLYGLDVVESADGPVVVDLNTFPGYKGVPDAAALLAEYIAAYAHGRIELPETALSELPPHAP
jgi:ribosomal protein S6--L-glutamate ligase